MNNPNTIKSIIFQTIKKYVHNKFQSNSSFHFKAPEQIEEYNIEFRSGDHLINISKLCLDDQSIINHVTYMINKDSLEILDDFYNNLKEIKIYEINNKNDSNNKIDNDIATKLYPFILYMFTEIFRDTAKGGVNLNLWIRNFLKEKIT